MTLPAEISAAVVLCLGRYVAQWGGWMAPVLWWLPGAAVVTMAVLSRWLCSRTAR
ncbi:hypothetical protein [Rugosimonospora africana]|uniref:Uncharacterized protein n=1 Tax=Rugosimonospora africana TaxID=556532 RepID=A0A8J3VVM4_9ACTN|nr:hypothetical protein [Rugosimonospora africana]GIH20079.1 hypothetical protein Raf01_82510 [Rugosimonospora africana]